MRIVLEDIVKEWHSADRSFMLRVPRFELSAGKVVLLRGENGTGKTTLLELISLAAAPSGGVMRLSGPQETHDISGLWKAGNRAGLARLRARHFGYVLQSIHLLPFLTIRENAVWVQKVAKRRDPQYLDELFERLDLSDRASALPGSLSPGLRQRAAIARALAHRPDFIIADEPTAALDPVAGEKVGALLVDLAQRQGTGVIMSMHREVQGIPDDAIHIHTRAMPASTDARLEAELVPEAA